MKLQKYLAELVGAFALTFGVYVGIAHGTPLPIAVFAGLILGTGVYTMGKISGAHFNPAVSIALATVNKLKWSDAVLYVVFQFIGAALAMFLANWLTGGVEPGVGVSNSVNLFVAEALGAAVLVVGVCSVVYGNVDDDAAGVTIGSSLLLGILFASVAGNGVINPAVAFGISSVSWIYLLAPVVGGIIAAWVYRYLAD